MRQTIWKFELETHDVQSIKMPKGANILTVQVQNGTPCLWAIVDQDVEFVYRNIEIFGTGHPMNVRLRRYIGTYQLMSGQLVFHVFELIS